MEAVKSRQRNTWIPLPNVLPESPLAARAEDRAGSGSRESLGGCGGLYRWSGVSGEGGIVRELV